MAEGPGRMVRFEEYRRIIVKKNSIEIGGLYTAKVSGKVVEVRIETAATGGGWVGVNTATGKRIRIKSAQRLRRAVRQNERQEIAASNLAEYPPDAPGCDMGDAPHQDEPTDGPADVGGPDATPNDEEPAMKKTKKTKKPAVEKPAKQAKAPKAAKQPKEKPAKRVSALDAAATVLKKKGEPMRAQEMIAAMADAGLWTSPGGKTPHATLYSAILREINTKGSESRFAKMEERGLFSYCG